MSIIFYIAALVALVSTVMVVTRKNAVHAFIYLVVSLLAVSVIFYISGAPFVAALEIIVYAGAIMILLLFAIMMLNLGKVDENDIQLMNFNTWIFPGFLCLVLLCELVYVFFSHQLPAQEVMVIGPKEVSQTLFSGYTLAIELTGMLLITGVVGAYHIGSEKKKEYHRYLQLNEETDE